MSFLSSLGKVFGFIGHHAAQEIAIAGLVTGNPLFGQVGALVIDAQKVQELVKQHNGTMSAEDKFNLVFPAAMKLVSDSEAAAGHQVVDTVRFQKGVRGLVNAAVDIYDSVDVRSVPLQI